MLGLSSSAEREYIEREYLEDDDAFQEMLASEDDLFDAYACGELTGEERRTFEQRFISSFREGARVRFARALASTVSTNQSAKTKILDTLIDSFRIPQAPGLLRIATIAAVIVLAAVFVWLLADRMILTRELRELRAESAELSKRTDALLRGSETKRTHTAESAAQLADLQTQPGKPKDRERRTIATQRATLDGVSVAPRNTHFLIPRNASRGSSSTVRGIAKDPNGNLVSGAIVTLSDSARRFTRTQYTNQDGAYVFNAVPPGTYSIEIQARGFKTTSVSGLVALAGTPTSRELALEFGAVSETVNVTTAAEPTINTSDAILGNRFESKLITELPLNANNVVGLLSLQPGVSGTGYVSGGRTDQSNITLDGVDVHDAIRTASFQRWIRFQLALETVPIQDHFRITIKTADGRRVTSVDWIEPVTPNQTIIDTPAIASDDLPAGNYVLELFGEAPNGSFIKLAEYSFKVIKY